LSVGPAGSFAIAGTAIATTASRIANLEISLVGVLEMLQIIFDPFVSDAERLETFRAHLT
jgi:hypothetical protein